jgi:hypothetical protein
MSQSTQQTITAQQIATVLYSTPKPQSTFCQGEALLLATRILETSYEYCLKAGELNVPTAVRQIVYKAKRHIGKQYADWLRGEVS